MPKSGNYCVRTGYKKKKNKKIKKNIQTDENLNHFTLFRKILQKNSPEVRQLRSFKDSDCTGDVQLMPESEKQVAPGAAAFQNCRG